MQLKARNNVQSEAHAHATSSFQINYARKMSSYHLQKKIYKVMMSLIEQLRTATGKINKHSAHCITFEWPDSWFSTVSSSKLVLKTVESRFAVLNYFAIHSNDIHKHAQFLVFHTMCTPTPVVSLPSIQGKRAIWFDAEDNKQITRHLRIYINIQYTKSSEHLQNEKDPCSAALCSIYYILLQSI
jgi:hypothetical protein